jgi:hypothetical protein
MEIAITVVLAALILMVEHYLPWEQALQMKAHLIVKYVIGTMGLIIPLTVLYLCWGREREALALWLVTAGGGLAVMAAHWLDHWLSIRSRMHAAEREAQLLRPEINDETEGR